MGAVRVATIKSKSVDITIKLTNSNLNPREKTEAIHSLTERVMHAVTCYQYSDERLTDLKVKIAGRS